MLNNVKGQKLNKLGSIGPIPALIAAHPKIVKAKETKEIMLTMQKQNQLAHEYEIKTEIAIKKRLCDEHRNELLYKKTLAEAE